MHPSYGFMLWIYIYTHTYIHTYIHTYVHTPRCHGNRTKIEWFLNLFVSWSAEIQCVDRQYNMSMTSQIVWYNSKQWRIQRKKNICIVCLCLCLQAWVKLCAHTFCMWLHCFDMLSCPGLWQQVVWVGLADPWVFQLEILVYSITFPLFSYLRALLLLFILCCVHIYK